MIAITLFKKEKARLIHSLIVVHPIGQPAAQSRNSYLLKSQNMYDIRIAVKII